MGLLELCFLSLLLPQQPAPQLPSASPDPATATAARQEPAPVAGDQPDPAEVLAMQAAERAGKDVDLQALEKLAGSHHAAIASRAAWLLGQQLSPQALEVLQTVATSVPHPDARIQAMAALLQKGNKNSVTAATAGLDDGDRRVRALAAQVLGKLRRPTSKAALLALLDRSTRATNSSEPAIDVQAAILALNDMAATDQLLPAATAVQAGAANSCGQALTFYFQNLSPKLPKAEEVTLLLSVLDHREAMLRRYAISRLGELAEPTTAVALERRLGSEGPELRPLLEVALTRVRNQKHGDQPAQPTAENPGFLAGLQQRWNGLSEQQQMVTAGFGGLFVLACTFVGFMWRRRRRALVAATHASVTDLIAPSEEYLEDLEVKAQELASEAETVELEETNFGDELRPGEETAWGASMPRRVGVRAADDS